MTNPDDEPGFNRKGAERDIAAIGGIESIKNGDWFARLVGLSLRAYSKNAAPEYFRRKYPGMSDDQISAKLITLAAKNAALVGGTSGAVMTAGELSALASGGAGLPIAIPAAVGSITFDMVCVTRIQLKLLASLAALYGRRLDPDDPEDVMLVIQFFLGGKASDAIGAAGSKGGSLAAKQFVSKFIAKETLKRIQAIGKIVGLKILQRTIRNVAVPVVSIGIGAGSNYLTTRFIAKKAQKMMKARAEEHARHNRLSLGSDAVKA